MTDVPNGDVPACTGVKAPVLTGAACRAARALLRWSMRDLQEASGVSLPTLVKLEAEGGVSIATATAVSAAFRLRGVEVLSDGGAGARLVKSEKVRADGRPALGRYVVPRKRHDGTYRILFEVPARLRPKGWPATIQLPRAGPSSGNLSDLSLVQAVRADARILYAELRRARRAMPIGA